MPVLSRQIMGSQQATTVMKSDLEKVIIKLLKNIDKGFVTLTKNCSAIGTIALALFDSAIVYLAGNLNSAVFSAKPSKSGMCFYFSAVSKLLRRYFLAWH
jgi:hypothetical protein